MPEQDSLEHGTPGHDTPGHGTPGHGTPEHDAPEHGTPGHGEWGEPAAGTSAERHRLESDFLLAMRQAGSIMQLLGQVSAERIGINVTDLNCLNIVALTGPMTAGDLARATGLTTASITGVLDRLEQSGFICSMSRKGNCWDNAVVESFFSTLDFECGDQRSFPDRATAHRAVADYILGFYNPTRLHSYLGYRSPMEFEREAA